MHIGIGEGCFEMECAKKIRAPARRQVQRAPGPEKLRRAQENSGARAAAAQRSLDLGAGHWSGQSNFELKKLSVCLEAF